uniref:glucuronosyltransferase n=1 Tax=Meloidogyne hapla TaxID=6305 RepID=A0A1I8BP49_MELHA
MVNIIWLAFFFFPMTLMEFGVDSMQTVRLGESSTGFMNKVKHLFSKKDKEPKKILLLADKFLTHYNFAYFVVVKYDNEPIKLKPVEGVHLIVVPYVEDTVYSQNGYFVKMPPEANWKPKREFKEEGFFKLIGFYMFSFHKAVTANPVVQIKGKRDQIFDWLKKKVKENFFDLGIAEFCVMTGAFPLFEQIGLKKYIATSAASPFPVYLHFLERFHAKPGQVLKEYGLQEEDRETNAQVYVESINKFLKFYKQREEVYLKSKSDGIPKIGDLLRKSRYYLINVHPIGQYSDTKMSERIVNIGGIENEMEDYMKKKKINIQKKQEDVPESSSSNQLGDFPSNAEEQNWLDTECLVIFSMGTAVKFVGFTEQHFNTLFKTFSNRNYNHCKFLVRVGSRAGESITEEIISSFNLIQKFGGYMNEAENILFYEGRIKQREILGNPNVRLFVAHGGQNSFNEILKAGVPIIVIPFFGDQAFNATIAEYLGIGVAIKLEEFFEKFQSSFDQIMNEGTPQHSNFYKRNAKLIKDAIQKAPKYGQIDTFIGIVKMAIKEDAEESHFSMMPGEITIENLELDALPMIVQKFSEKIEQEKKSPIRKFFGRIIG